LYCKAQNVHESVCVLCYRYSERDGMDNPYSFARRSLPGHLSVCVGGVRLLSSEQGLSGKDMETLVKWAIVWVWGYTDIWAVGECRHVVSVVT
jgi:hypothetical protein